MVKELDEKTHDQNNMEKMPMSKDETPLSSNEDNGAEYSSMKEQKRHIQIKGHKDDHEEMLHSGQHRNDQSAVHAMMLMP